ncbi:hypothetical protein Tco_1242945 [Tanacetum coccineum]
MNTASSSSSGPLPSNTIANPRGDLKAITTRSGISYDGPLIPPLPKVVEQEPELDECLALTDLSASINLMPLFIWKKLSLPELTSTQMILELADRSTTRPADIAEDVFVKVGKTRRALIDVYGEELTLCHDDEAVTFKVGQTSRYFYNNAESINRIDVIDVACGEYAQEGDIRLLEEFLNDDPLSPLPPQELRFVEPKTKKTSIDDPPELELKDLSSHLEYAFLEGTDKLPIIIAKDLKEDEKVRLLKVLKSHKRAIAWNISNIKGIDP